MLSLIMLILFGMLCAGVGWTAHGTYMERKELDD